MSRKAIVTSSIVGGPSSCSPGRGESGEISSVHRVHFIGHLALAAGRTKKMVSRSGNWETLLASDKLNRMNEHNNSISSRSNR